MILPLLCLFSPRFSLQEALAEVVNKTAGHGITLGTFTHVKKPGVAGTASAAASAMGGGILGMAGEAAAPKKRSRAQLKMSLSREAAVAALGSETGALLPLSYSINLDDSAPFRAFSFSDTAGFSALGHAARQGACTHGEEGQLQLCVCVCV